MNQLDVREAKGTYLLAIAGKGDIRAYETALVWPRVHSLLPRAVHFPTAGDATPHSSKPKVIANIANIVQLQNTGFTILMNKRRVTLVLYHT